VPRERSSIVTLTSDFGLADAYVAEMKAAVLRHSPRAQLIDVTHQVPRHDLLCGAIQLERAIAAFERGTVHLAVVDPGVGTRRRLLVVRIAGQFVVCPDNGLITWAWRRQGRGRAFEVTWRPKGRRASATFHGRDILAPLAGMLAAGKALASLARPLRLPVLLDVAPMSPGESVGRIIHIDHFGNATTNVPRESLPADATIRVRGRLFGRLRSTYADVARGRPLALIGSSGLLELAMREGSAAKRFALNVGDRVRVE
jgi:hypothetical protein